MGGDLHGDFLSRAWIVGEPRDRRGSSCPAVIHAGTEKVHLDVRVNRFRADDSLISQFKTIWVMAFIDGKWAAQLRSVFSPISLGDFEFNKLACALA